MSLDSQVYKDPRFSAFPSAIIRPLFATPPSPPAAYR